MSTRTIKILSFVIALLVLVPLIKFGSKALRIMGDAPPGMHGNYNPPERKIYKTILSKDALLHQFENNGLIVKSGRLHDYDPPWDSLRYLIGDQSCDGEKIEPVITFDKEKKNDSTILEIGWINATPDESYDRAGYDAKVKQYYGCFEETLKRCNVQPVK